MAQSSTPFALPSGCTLRPAMPTDRWGIIKLYFAVFDRDSLLRSLIKALQISLSTLFFIFILLFGFIGIGILIQNFAEQWLWKHNGYFLPYNLPNNLMRVLQNYAYLISFTLTTTAVSVWIFNFTKKSLPGVWVVECDRHIVAVARLERRPQYSQITSLYVTPRYRQRGLGSCLLQKLIQDANKPVFLICLPELVGFYARFGFIRASKENVPPQLKFLIHDRFTFLTLFIPDPAVSSPPIAANKVNRLANSPNGSYVIRQVQFREVNKIQKMIFNSANLDILLPFGLSLKTIYSLVALVTKLFILMLIIGWVGLLIIVILPSSGGGIASEMKKYDDYRWVTESVSTLAIYYAGGLFVLMLIAVISGFTVSRQYNNFWIAEQNGKIVGYARLSSCDRYSILHYLHIDSKHLTENLDRQLIEHLSQRVRKPIYLACSEEFIQRYKHLGFMPILTRNLPQKLRFGGILNQQFGGNNLVLR